jgi:hypothetical protein
MILDSGADRSDTPIMHTGLEFVYCPQGVISDEVYRKTYYLAPGDSLLFEAYLTHR